MKKSRGAATAAVFASAVLAGCSTFTATSCPASLTPMKEAQLLFGRAIAGGSEVSDVEWQRFVDEEVTPRFPDGLSVVDASGQWKGGAGVIRERSKLLLIVLNGKSGEHDRLEAVRSAYRARFHQESVLLIETPVCAGF